MFIYAVEGRVQTLPAQKSGQLPPEYEIQRVAIFGSRYIQIRVYNVSGGLPGVSSLPSDRAPFSRREPSTKMASPGRSARWASCLAAVSSSTVTVLERGGYLEKDRFFSSVPASEE